MEKIIKLLPKELFIKVFGVNRTMNGLLGSGSDCTNSEILFLIRGITVVAAGQKSYAWI